MINYIAQTDYHKMKTERFRKYYILYCVQATMKIEYVLMQMYD